MWIVEGQCVGTLFRFENCCNDTRAAKFHLNTNKKFQKLYQLFLSLKCGGGRGKEQEDLE